MQLDLAHACVCLYLQSPQSLSNRNLRPHEYFMYERAFSVLGPSSCYRVTFISSLEDFKRRLRLIVPVCARFTAVCTSTDVSDV